MNKLAAFISALIFLIQRFFFYMIAYNPFTVFLSKYLIKLS